MAVVAVDGGTNGGIQYVYDHAGKCWLNKKTDGTFDTNRTNWSQFDFLAKFKGITEANGKTTGER